MIPLARPSLDSTEVREVSSVLDSRWLAGGGPKSQEFSKKLADYLGVEYVITVNSCTSALHLSLLSLGVKPGDEVLVGDYTFPSTAFAVLYCGAKPVFVDVEKETYNMSPVDLKRKISKRSKAVIPVHLFGQTADMSLILKLVGKNDLKVVEDAALGAKYKAKMAGTLGDVGCFSFHARKNVTTGEGGAVATNSRQVAEKVNLLSNFGISPAYDRSKKGFHSQKFTTLGFNYKLSDVNAAIGLAQLKKSNGFIKERRRLARYYCKRLLEANLTDLVEPPAEAEDCLHVYQSYVALVDKKVNLVKLINSLRKDGIECNIGSYSCHIQPVFKSKDRCPVSREISSRALALPMYNGLSFKEIDIIVSSLKRNIKKDCW